METRHGHSANLETMADRRGLPFVQPGNRVLYGLCFRLVVLSTVVAAQSSFRPVNISAIIPCVM